jgi:hypothetical protein
VDQHFRVDNHREVFSPTIAVEIAESDHQPDDRSCVECPILRRGHGEGEMAAECDPVRTR